MIKTENPTLQSVLKQKYNIDETLYAEGRFVSLIGDYAPSLVCLGLSLKCLIVARVDLSDDVMDYDLLSIIPLTVLSFSCDWIHQKIKIRNSFKPVHMFQLCSSANQAEVWDNFTTIIQIVQQEKCEIWQVASLKPVSYAECPWSPVKAQLTPQISYKEGINDVHDHGFMDMKFESFVNEIIISDNDNNNNVGTSDNPLAKKEKRPSAGRKIARFFSGLFSRCKMS